MATKYVKSLKFSTSGETYQIRDAETKARVDSLEPVVAGKQDALEAGVNIKTINNLSLLGSGNITIEGGSGTSDYTQLDNKPQINGTTLTGNKSASDLGLATSSDLSTHTGNATIHVTAADKTVWTAKQDKLTSANAGTNITITEESGIVKISSTGGTGGTTNYNDLTNKPQIGGTTLSGNKSAADLGLQSKIDASNKLSVALVDGAATSSDLAGKQNKLTSANAGTNVTITEESGVVKINATGGSGGTSDYTQLTNKPQINSIELSGNKGASDLGLLESNQGSENSGKVLGIDNTGSVVPVTVSTAENTVTVGALEDLEDTLEFADENGNIALKVAGDGTVKTIGFDSSKIPEGYERYYPLTFTGYFNQSGTIVTSNATDYLYTEIYVDDLQGETIFINNDPNETYCMFKNAAGQIISSWSTAVKSVRVPFNAHLLCLSNCLLSGVIDFHIVRPVRAKPIAKGMINYLDFTRPQEIVWQDVSGGKIDGTMTEGAGLVLTNGASHRVIANKVVVLNTFTTGADIVLPEPTAETEGGVTTYTYTGCVVIGTDVTGYGSNHASCIVFDFANKTIKLMGDGNGTNHTGTAIKSGTITNAFADGCRNFQIKVYREDGNLTATIVCTDSGKSDSVYQAVQSSTAYNSAGNMYDRPHIYSVSGSTVFKNFWVSAAYNPQCVMCGDSITQGSRNPLADVWSYKFANYLGNNAVSAGRGSGGLPSAMNSIATVVPALRPKSIIVAIGTNGTAYPSDVYRYEYMKLICDYYGVVFIACTPWACESRAQCDTRAGYIRSLNTQYAEFNHLTKAGFKESGAQVTSYFASDNVHLSQSGNTLTYDYLVAKFGWIKNI